MTSPTTPRRLPLNHCYTPSRSSPLSSHPQTTPQNRFGLRMLPSPPSSPPEFLAPKRLFKPVPSSHSREEGREARRNLFLKKVRDARDEKLLKARGGEDEVLTSISFQLDLFLLTQTFCQMMRLIFVSEQKRWEASQARTAASIPTIYEEEELGMGNEELDFQAEESFFIDQDGIYHTNSTLSLLSNSYCTEPGPSDDLDEMLDRDGKELEDLLSQLDLQLDQVMPEANGETMPT